MDKPTLIEKHAGSVVAQGALAALAAQVATPLAALLPVLANSLAAERHKKRVENALSEIDAQLREHSDVLQSLSDDQFKFVNEVVLAVLQTTEDEKLAYLKRAISNGLRTDADLGYSAQLSRILRDIAAAEIRFLIENFQFERIVFDVEPGTDRGLRVNGGSSQEIAVTGLIALGLIVPAGSTIKTSGAYRFSLLVAKLVALVRS
jgi:hypothetical protein